MIQGQGEAGTPPRTASARRPGAAPARLAISRYRTVRQSVPAYPGAYPARAGGPWLCRTLVLSLFHAVVVPSGLRTRVQPQRWIAIW